MQRYLLAWLLATGTLIFAVSVVNFMVDPYNLFQIAGRNGLNAIKPKAGVHVAMTKPYQVLRIRPRGLILGNSRAEVGFDPEHTAWPDAARPVFNLALPGTGVSTALRHLQHVLAADAVDVKVVLLGLDLMDFLVNADLAPRHLAPEDENNRLLVHSDGSTNASRPMQVASDYAASTFSLTAFIDSLQTLVSQGNPRTKDRTPLGFNPMRDYLKVTADEGYWAVFRQADIANMQAYRVRPRDLSYRADTSSVAMEDLLHIIELCRKHGMRLHLVIYPYHARLLETMRITGHWHALEEWKRLLVRIVGNAASSGHADWINLWDFADFNAYSTEDVPAEHDRQTSMRWYWDGGHFKKELGDIVLDRVLDKRLPEHQFGTLINAGNIEAVISAQRKQATDFREVHRSAVSELEAIAEQLVTSQSDH